MKALSLWQPWAQLIALGHKTIETRSWATVHRGPLLIHAAKRPLDEHARALCAALHLHEDMPMGCIVALVDLVDVKPTTHFSGLFGDENGQKERLLGDYRPGRYGWCLKLRKRFSFPLFTPGRQRLFEVSPEVLAAHTNEIQRAVTA